MKDMNSKSRVFQPYGHWAVAILWCMAGCFTAVKPIRTHHYWGLLGSAGFIAVAVVYFFTQRRKKEVHEV
jgi:Zn-dependent protease